LCLYSLERKEFDRVFLEVANDVLRRILGEAAVSIICQCLQKRKGIRWEEIPCRIEEFSSGLNGLLGSSAHTLESLMIEHLAQELRLEYYDNPEIGFVDQVRTLRKMFEEKKI